MATGAPTITVTFYLGKRNRKSGKGAFQLSQLPFKEDFVGAPPKKKTTLAFTSLTRIGHGASSICKGDWGDAML